MSEKFDPYYKWLGIPPKDQPPHHYRLLGLELLESDAEVIDAAANRLMEYLQGMAVGSRLAQSQSLLNEISAARLCLLDPKKKAAYDKQLQAEQAAAEQVRGKRRLRGRNSPDGPPPPTGPPSAPLPFQISTDPQEASASHGDSPAHRAPRKQPPWAGIIALGIGLLVVSGLAVYVIFYRSVNTGERDSNQPQARRPAGRLTPRLGFDPESPFKDPPINPDRRPPFVDPPEVDPEKKTPEKKTPEKKTPEKKTPEKKTPEKKTPEKKTPKDKPPKKTKPPKTEPKPKDKQPFNPSTHPKEFLHSHGLIQKGAFWILEEGPLTKRVSSLAKLEKTYRAVSNTLAVSLKNLNKIRTQLKTYKRQAERLKGLGRLPPAKVANFINQWDPKVGSDRAIAAFVDLRNLILAKIKARDELTIPFLQLNKEIVSREEAYQRFAADLQMGEALSKLAGNIRYRLGPSSGFKPTLAKLKKYETMLMTDEVPFYLQGRDTFISAVLNENTPLVFSNNPSMKSNLIPAAVLKKAGIVVDPAAMKVTLDIKFGKKKRKFACRLISIPTIRFGGHVLKNLKFFVTPPQAADLGAVLGGSAFDGYRVEADRDKFVFKIRPRDKAVKGKKKP